MPLSTGVRPLIEDMPTTDPQDIQKYTANTTVQVLAFMNDGADSDQPVTREEMETLMDKDRDVGSARKKQLITALFGPGEPTKEQQARAERLQRYHLGGKTTKVWVGGRMLKNGAGKHYENEGSPNAYHPRQPLARVGGYFEPATSDPRGEFRHRDLLLDWEARHHARHSNTAAVTTRQADSSEPKKLGGIVGGQKRVAVYIVDNDIVPETALQMARQMLKATFEHTCIRAAGLTLSVGEAVALARHDETLHVPNDTARERAFLQQLRAASGAALEALLMTDELADLDALLPVPKWRGEYLEVTRRVLESRAPWLGDAVHVMHRLIERGEALREHATAQEEAKRASAMNPQTSKARPHKLAPGHVPAPPSRHERRPSLSMRDPAPVRPATARSEQSRAACRAQSALDREWQDRIEVLRTRDRRFLREELECFFEACLIPVTPPVVVGKSPVEFAPALRPRIRHSAAAAPAEGATGDGRRNSDASRPRVRPSTTGSDRSRRGKKRRPLEGITTRELLDSPRYWFDDRLVEGNAEQGGRERVCSTRQAQALQSHIHDPEEFLVGPVTADRDKISSKLVAMKMLKRSDQARPHVFETAFLSKVMAASGVVPGQPPSDGDVPGASRGACQFRVVPAFGVHTALPKPVPHAGHPRARAAGPKPPLPRERSSHPASRPCDGHVHSYDELLEIQDLLLKPSIDYKEHGEKRHSRHHQERPGSGQEEDLVKGPRITRPPTMTPGALRKRLQRDMEERRLRRLYGMHHIHSHDGHNGMHHIHSHDGHAHLARPGSADSSGRPHHPHAPMHKPHAHKKHDKNIVRKSEDSIKSAAVGLLAVHATEASMGADETIDAAMNADHDLEGKGPKAAMKGVMFGETSRFLNVYGGADDQGEGGEGGEEGEGGTDGGGGAKLDAEEWEQLQRVAGSDAPSEASAFEPSARPGGAPEQPRLTRRNTSAPLGSAGGTSPAGGASRAAAGRAALVRSHTLAHPVIHEHSAEDDTASEGS